MIPQDRPPLNTPAGCFMSNTAASLFFLIAAFFGAIVGNQIADEQGMRVGLVMMTVLSLFTPWRRWALRWWQERQRSRPSNTPEP